MHIDGVEARPHECRRHLVLAIDALLPEDRDARFAPANKRRGNIIRRIEIYLDAESRVFAIEDAIVLLARRFGIITQSLDSKTRLRPCSLQNYTVKLQDHPIVVSNSQTVAGIGPTNRRYSSVILFENRQRLGQIAIGHLHYRAELLAEQLCQYIVAGTTQIQCGTLPAGKHHFRDGRQQPAVRAVVIGKNQALFAKLLY